MQSEFFPLKLKPQALLTVIVPDADGGGRLASDDNRGARTTEADRESLWLQLKGKVIVDGDAGTGNLYGAFWMEGDESLI